jgi:hypothetical protein
MLNPKVITINNWKRPAMYKRVLDALMLNPEIDEYEIINIVDKHPNKMFAKRFKKIDEESGLDVTTVIAEEHLGCAGAKGLAFKLGFETGASFVINLEDDIVPGLSFLHYMEWGNQEFRDNEEVHAVIGWSRCIKEGDFNEVQVRTPDKTYQAFGIWDTTWAETGNGENWFGIHWNEAGGYKPKDGEGHLWTGEEFLKATVKTLKGSWGWVMLNYWRRNRKCAIPTISRCQNIGNIDGAFNFNPDWHRQWIHNTVWAEDRPAPDSYHIVEKR